jgi:toxin-antitoxin system PIN domain toxin
VNPVALLDVNVLVALFDPEHVHHEAAHRWFGAERRHGWATCPLTENGLVRILSNPTYPGFSEPPTAVADRFRAFRESGSHAFWSDDVSLLDRSRVQLSRARGHRQITDVYLLALAVNHGGRLATFDRTIPLVSVSGATTGHLTVLPL